MDLYDLPWDVINIILDYKNEMEELERFYRFFNTVFSGLFYLIL